jgi:hypothetical protein
VAWHEFQIPLPRNGLQLTNGVDCDAGVAVDEGPDRYLVVDVLDEVGCIAREYKTSRPYRCIVFDGEALMPRGMTERGQRGYAEGYFNLAVGTLPPDCRIVEVDAINAVPFGIGILQPILEFASLDVNRNSMRKVPQTACVIIVEMGNGYYGDGLQAKAHGL